MGLAEYAWNTLVLACRYDMPMPAETGATYARWVDAHGRDIIVVSEVQSKWRWEFENGTCVQNTDPGEVPADIDAQWAHTFVFACLKAIDVHRD